MAGYTKLFHSILLSTVWLTDASTRLVWIALLAMADKDGIAEASVPGLAAIARVPVDDCRRALDTLLAPDRDSRSPEFEGRRIEVVDGGWRLLNHAKYRAKMNADDRRDYLTKKKREQREREAQTSTRRQQKSTFVAPAGQLGQHNAEAEEEPADQQDQSAAADVLQNCDIPLEPSSDLPVLTRLAHETLDEVDAERVTAADQYEHLKTAAARADLHYDAELVRKALDSAAAVRSLQTPLDSAVRLVVEALQAIGAPARPDELRAAVYKRAEHKWPTLKFRKWRDEAITLAWDESVWRAAPEKIRIIRKPGDTDLIALAEWRKPS